MIFSSSYSKVTYAGKLSKLKQVAAVGSPSYLLTYETLIGLFIFLNPPSGGYLAPLLIKIKLFHFFLYYNNKYKPVMKNKN